MSPFDSDAILDLVGSIYDVALSEDRWEPMLQQMTELFGGTAAVFFVRDRLGSETVFARFWGLSDAALSESVQLFTAVDVGLDTPLSLPPGSVTTEETSPQLPRSEVLGDFLRRWDVERYVGGDVFRDARRLGVVAVLGSQRRAPFGPTEIEALKTLIPHLRRAVELRSHLDAKDANRSVAQDVIEGMLTGVILLDASGHVLTANATARRIARLQDGLLLSRNRLRAASNTEDDALQKAITEAIAISQRGASNGGAPLIVGRLSGARPYAILVSPGASGASQPAFRIASAVVLIGDPDSALASAEEIAIQLYGLTPSEARLACAIASGESLESYASARGINVSTARWTMKKALAKTGARRQADLVRLLLTGPVAVAKSQPGELSTPSRADSRRGASRRALPYRTSARESSGLLRDASPLRQREANRRPHAIDRHAHSDPHLCDRDLEEISDDAQLRVLFEFHQHDREWRPRRERRQHGRMRDDEAVHRAATRYALPFRSVALATRAERPRRKAPGAARAATLHPEFAARRGFPVGRAVVVGQRKRCSDLRHAITLSPATARWSAPQRRS